MQFKTEIVFVRILLPFAAGILTFYPFPELLIYTALGFLSVALLLCLILVNIFYKKLNVYRHKGSAGLLIYIFLFFACGFLCIKNNQQIRPDYFSRQKAESYKVTIADEPQLSNSILRFTANVNKGFTGKKIIPVLGKVMVAIQLDSQMPVHLKYGDALIIKAALQDVEPPYNPAEFDFKGWLATQNIYHQVFVTQNNLIKTGENKGNTFIRHALSIRQQQISVYRNLIKNDEAFAVASTLILGYRSALSKETLAAYSRTGTIHALSVSGAHVAIIYFFLNYLLFFMEGSTLLKLIKLFIICTLLWSYAMLTGFSPAVLRAVIMVTVFIIARSCFRATNSYNILAFSAFCMLVYNPFYLFDAGFQLSYLAVLGLLYLQPEIYLLIHIKNKYLDKLWNITALSLAAQLITFPLSIYYFHQFPVYFLLGNLFILLPVNAIMGLGVVVLIPGLQFCGPLLEWVITFTNGGLKKIAGLPLSGIQAIYISKIELILLSAALLLLILALHHLNKRLLFTSFLLFFVFQLLLSKGRISAISQKRILFFSLRKNYAAAFISSDSAIVVTDLSLNDKTYSYLILPALDKFKVDHIILSPLDKKVQMPNFKMLDHQILFYKYRILLVTNFFNNKTINGFPAFSAVWLHKNPQLSLLDLRISVNSNLMILDATNKDLIIRKYSLEAEKYDFALQILKKNASYLVDLK